MLTTAFQGNAGPCVQDQMSAGLEVDLLTRLNHHRLPYTGVLS